MAPPTRPNAYPHSRSRLITGNAPIRSGASRAPDHFRTSHSRRPIRVGTVSRDKEKTPFDSPPKESPTHIPTACTPSLATLSRDHRSCSHRMDVFPLSLRRSHSRLVGQPERTVLFDMYSILTQARQQPAPARPCHAALHEGSARCQPTEPARHRSVRPPAPHIPPDLNDIIHSASGRRAVETGAILDICRNHFEGFPGELPGGSWGCLPGRASVGYPTFVPPSFYSVFILYNLQYGVVSLVQVVPGSRGHLGGVSAAAQSWERCMPWLRP